MSAGFIWTVADDAELVEMHRAGADARAIGAALGCSPEHVAERRRSMGLARASTAPSTDVTRVPRPVARPDAGRRAPLIDISRAPSLMEQRFSREPGPRR